MRRRVAAEEAAKAARAAGEAKLAELKGGKAEPTGFGPAKTVSRANGEGLPPPVIEAAYRLPSDPLPAYTGVDLGGGQGYAIVQVVKVATPPAEDLAKRDAAIGPQLERLVAQQDATAYVDAIKGRTRIVRHPERLGGSAAQP